MGKGRNMNQTITKTSLSLGAPGPPDPVTIMHAPGPEMRWHLVNCVQMRVCSLSVLPFSLPPPPWTGNHSQLVISSLTCSRPQRIPSPPFSEARRAVTHFAHICGFLSELVICLRRDVNIYGSEQGRVTVQESKVPATFRSCRWFSWRRNIATYYLFHFLFLKMWLI